MTSSALKSMNSITDNKFGLSIPPWLLVMISTSKVLLLRSIVLPTMSIFPLISISKAGKVMRTASPLLIDLRKFSCTSATILTFAVFSICTIGMPGEAIFTSLKEFSVNDPGNRRVDVFFYDLAIECFQ